jgi:hypothetical protein
MPHLVRDIIDPEGVAGGGIDAGFAECLAAGDAGHTDTGHAAARRAEDVADVIIGIADDEIEIGLVLCEQQAGVVAGVRIGDRVGINDKIVFGDENEANSGFGFVYAIDAVDRRNDCGESARDCAAKKLRIFAGRSTSETVGPHRVVTNGEWLESGFLTVDGFIGREAREFAFGSTIIAFVVAGVEVCVAGFKWINIESAVGRKNLGMEAGGD